MISILALTIIVLALSFDFINGFHDSANSIATIIATRTLKPFQAVLLAGMANFAGYFLFGIAIANTVGKGIVDIQYITLPLLFSALMGAIIWNIITWILGLPTSSSHALIGGLVGAGIAAAGMKAVISSGVLKIFSFIFVAPVIGAVGSVILTVIVMRVFAKTNRFRVEWILKKLQLVSSTFLSLGHGTNDAQKTMGIIALVLLTAGVNSTFQVNEWVILSCFAAISLGTAFGGWRIVKTMGGKVTKIGPQEGFCSETASSIVLIGTAHFGIPVSTTHVIAGSIMGAGSVKGSKAVRWITARRILWAWVLTIPLTALCSALFYFIFSWIL